MLPKTILYLFVGFISVQDVNQLLLLPVEGLEELAIGDAAVVDKIGLGNKLINIGFVYLVTKNAAQIFV